MKIDWKRKLTSRKFWLSVASFISLLVVALGHSESVAAEVSAIIMSGATVIGYVIGEGLADNANLKDDANAFCKAKTFSKTAKPFTLEDDNEH